VNREPKTTAHTDAFHGRFEKLVTNEQVVEVVEFETTDPALRGEMTITITLADADGGTDVLAVHDRLPADRRQRGRLAVVTRETRGARRGGLVRTRAIQLVIRGSPCGSMRRISSGLRLLVLGRQLLPRHSSRALGGRLWATESRSPCSSSISWVTSA
jgi:hypothetical protein